MSRRSSSSKANRPGFGLMALLLLGVLGLLLGRAWLPGQTLFSNDGPLGRLMSDCHQLPSRFFGCWQDLNSIGYREGSAVPGVSYGLEWVLGPLGFSKFYASVALFFLGASAWCLFRQWRLAPAACLLGGLAASLNSTFFSAACWGVAAHAIAVGMGFLALAALARVSSPQRWLRVPLAGFALGIAVVEGADVGAIFSLLVATFVCYQAWVIEGSSLGALGGGLVRVAIMAVCAVALAASSVGELLVTNVEGVVAAGPTDTRSDQGHWDWATQWSLPKTEALGLVVPGLFGYRTDTPQGGNYWGATGRHPAWDRYFASGQQGPRPTGLLRFVGGGNYAGIAVVLVALWAVVQSFRKKDPLFDASSRKLVWFWSAVALVSLLMAFGRFAPFYRLLYALPYFSTIRNPVKFVHVFSLALVVLFALGVDGLWRGFFLPSAVGASKSAAGLKSWWAMAARIEKLWVGGCAVVLGLSLVAWVVYGMRVQALAAYMESVNFSPYAASLAADFSVRQVGWFVLFFALAAGMMTLIFSRFFSGAGAGAGMVLLGLVVVCDLGRANLPWIRFWDYRDKYATNPVFDRLREKPYEHRVGSLSRGFVSEEFQRTFKEDKKVASDASVISQLYQYEWAQHPFFYYNIQSLDIVELSRKPADLKAFEETFTPRSLEDFSRVFPRFWQLTNTRYFIGATGFLPYLNGKLDPVLQRFRILDRFGLQAKSGGPHARSWADFTAVSAKDGDHAIFEFTGALPRAKLYSNWQVNTNDLDSLRLLSDEAHHPEQTVLVAGGLPAGVVPGLEDQATGAATFVSYAPKDIVLKAEPSAPAVLLLNDRFDPAWTVSVDGRPEPLLRCNYLMRGVYLTAGSHTVEFRFQPPHRALYVSLAALCAATLLLGFVTWSSCRGESAPPSPAAPLRRGRATPKSRRKEAAKSSPIQA